MPAGPEDKAREKIDELLNEAGWTVQHYKDLNLGASLGVAVTYFPVESGEADYLLFVDRKAAGVLEAKAEGTTLSGVSEQSSGYLISLPKNIPSAGNPLPFSYESTGTETYFRDLRDPDSRSRSVFAFHEPETLRDWLSQGSTLRSRLQSLPPLITEGLRECQIQAIRGLEKSFAESRPRALIQMPSGSGKTFASVNFIYRLIKFAHAKRILFLVDRRTLGTQTESEFKKFVTPDDGRKFTELYNVQHMKANTIDPVSNVCTTTIQRLYSMLKGEEQFDPELEEISLFDQSYVQQIPKEVSYNAKIPIETFDFIVTDECHRSIYNLWRQVLEYFDAFIVGLTATPSKQTRGFFHQNLVMEYGQDRAVADGITVPLEVYSIRTKITQAGAIVDAGFYVDKRDKLTRKRRMELLDEELAYQPREVDRSVVAEDQIRTVIKTFKEKLFTEIFPGRNEVPKTLIFAKDDSHAEDIVNIVREEFGKGNDFSKKITYRTYTMSGEKPEDLIKSFCNSYNPRIAVTVDMISTGTDIKALECLLFMRDARSRTFFEQMKGRGSRTISSTDIQAVTPDTKHKTHYVVVDAVGVCESDKTESKPLERKRNVPFDKLLTSIALGNRDEDSISSLAGRLAMLSREIEEEDQQEIKDAAGGKSLRDIINKLVSAIDEDAKIEKAKQLFQTEEPTSDQINNAEKTLAEEACAPFDDSNLRNLLIDMRRRNEQTIDTITKDEVISAGYSAEAKQKAQAVIENFHSRAERVAFYDEG